MQKISFVKMVASGNDFVVVQQRDLPAKRYPLSAIAKKICNRKYGAGADGLLVLEESKKAAVKMRIFNADGSEAEMCGNGARCAAAFIVPSPSSVVYQKPVKIETKAGIIEAEVNKDSVKIKLTDPKDIKLNIPIKINGRTLKVNFINTGVPHTVIFAAGLDKIDVVSIGRQVRYHRQFAPAGTNVNFVEVLGSNSIKIRTYERGVEDETLACGTGSVASALLTTYNLRLTTEKINVHTQGGEVLKVYTFAAKNRAIHGANRFCKPLQYSAQGTPGFIPGGIHFNYQQGRFGDVWLEGKAKVVFKGEFVN